MDTWKFYAAFAVGIILAFIKAWSNLPAKQPKQTQDTDNG